MRKPIVAVIGGNSDVLEILDDVQRLGASLENRFLLLTGGRPAAAPTNVKDAAMNGASARGLMISVLPKTGKSNPALRLEKKERLLTLQTHLNGAGRDPITGAAADLIVSFHGGAGTLVELAYAASYRRHI